MQIKYTALAVMLLATALAGCGGGGGEGNGGSSVPPQSNPRNCILYALDCSIYNGYIAQGLSHQHAAERTKTLSIRMINADAAYQRGYDGSGVTTRIFRVWNSRRPPRTGRCPCRGRQVGMPARVLRNGSEPGSSCPKSCDFASSNCRRSPQWPGFCAAGHAWRRSRRPRPVHIRSKCRISSADG